MERGYPYEFTLDELGENVGLKVKNNSRGYEVVNNALTLLVNNGMLSLILFGIYKSAYTIELPSSLLPRENIFDWLHYKTEFGEILNALELLSSETAVSILKNFYHNLLLGVFVMIVVIVGGCVFICVEMYINN